MPRAVKGGRPDGVRGGRIGIAERGCRGQQGPGEQVEGGKTASAGRAAESGRNGRLFGQAVQDRKEGGISGVKSGAAQSWGGGWEGESGLWRMKGADPENCQTVGWGFKIRCNNSDGA